MITEIEVALIGGAVAAIGWYATYSFAKAREDRTRRIETHMKHLQRQIEELYGPIYSLIPQLFVADHIKSELLAQGHLSDIEKKKAHNYFHVNYFMPLHVEISEILKTRLYLADSVKIPDSFYQYQRHANQEKIQRELWFECDTDTRFVPGVEWPNDFYPDIERSLQSLMNRYEQAVERLK